MNSGTVITTTGTIDYGPSTFQARIGNPSPNSASPIQYVENSPTTFWDTIAIATKQAVKAAIGPGPATAAAVAKGAIALGEGAKEAAAGIGKAATSATSGIKIGAIVLTVLLGIVLIAQVRGALRT